MTELKGTIASSSPGVDTAFYAALREGNTNLIRDLREFTASYVERYGLIPAVIVVLAGTDICAALTIAGRDRDGFWSYDRDSGLLDLNGGRASIVVCEHPDLSGTECQILVPGYLSLGRPMTRKTTITVTVPA